MLNPFLVYPVFRLPALLISLFVCGHVPALKGEDPAGGMPYLALDAGDVFVATIKRVEDDQATHGNPPRVWFSVDEVLRGEGEVKRSPAVWAAPIDLSEAELGPSAEWLRRPLKGPLVGQKFILGGKLHRQDQAAEMRYALFPFIRIPYSEEARHQTMEQLKRLADVRQREMERRRAESQDRKRRMAQWIDGFDADSLRETVAGADAVAIGKVVTHSLSTATFEIERMLKGRPKQQVGGKYYVDVSVASVDPRVVDWAIWDRSRCILFLSEERLVVSVNSVQAKLVDSYWGIGPADKQVVKRIEKFLEDSETPEPQPLLVICTLDRLFPIELVKRLRSRFEVAVSHQFSALGPNVVPHIRKTIPSADLVVTLGRGKERSVKAYALQRTEDSLLYDAIWDDSASGDDMHDLIDSLPFTGRESSSSAAIGGSDSFRSTKPMLLKTGPPR